MHPILVHVATLAHGSHLAALAALYAGPYTQDAHDAVSDARNVRDALCDAAAIFEDPGYALKHLDGMAATYAAPVRGVAADILAARTRLHKAHVEAARMLREAMTAEPEQTFADKLKAATADDIHMDRGGPIELP